MVARQFPRTAIGPQELWRTEIRERFVSGGTIGPRGKYSPGSRTMSGIVAGLGGDECPLIGARMNQRVVVSVTR